MEKHKIMIQFIISMIIIIFSFYQLINKAQSPELYSSMITIILGFWMDSPISNKN